MLQLIPIISLFLCYPTSTTSNAEDELAPMVPLLSDDLYMTIFRDKNSSLPMDRKGYQPLRKEDIVGSRRYYPFEYLFNALAWVDFWVPKTEYHVDGGYHACWNINGIYRGALRYIHRYYLIRTLYVNTKEYDVGYITHQIIWRYQIMIETYHIIITRFVESPGIKLLPINPFFYFYTNMLEQAQVIEVLVNMLVHVETKYAGVTHKHWDDSTTRTRRRKTKARGPSAENDTITTTLPPKTTTPFDMGELDRAAAYERQRAEQLRKRKKALKRQRKQQLLDFHRKYTRPTYPWTKRKGIWELDYGWSIENW